MGCSSSQPDASSNKKKGPLKFIDLNRSTQSASLDISYQTSDYTSYMINEVLRKEGVENVKIVNPNKMKRLPELLLKKCSQVKTVNLSELTDIEEIGADFLSECDSICEIDLSSLKNVKKIDSGFLSQCKGLKTPKLDFFNQLEEIGDNFMTGCIMDSFTTEKLLKVKKVGSHFLESCTNLTSINLSGFSLVTELGAYFLYNCGALNNIDLSPLKNVTLIGTHFLEKCQKLGKIDLTPLEKLQNIGGPGILEQIKLKNEQMKQQNKSERYTVGFLANCTSLSEIRLTQTQKNMLTTFLDESAVTSKCIVK